MDTGIRGLLCYGVVKDIASYTRKYKYIQPRAYHTMTESQCKYQTNKLDYFVLYIDVRVSVHTNDVKVNKY